MMDLLDDGTVTIGCAFLPLALQSPMLELAQSTAFRAHEVFPAKPRIRRGSFDALSMGARDIECLEY